VAAELKQYLDVDARLIIGSPGEFTVWVDGTKVADKAEIGRFPDPSDVVAAIRGQLA